MPAFRLFRSYLKTPYLILLAIETCVIFGAVYSASALRYYAVGLEPANAISGLLDTALVVTLVTVLCMLSTGLYVSHLREGMAGVLIRIAIGLLFSSAIVGLLFYLLPELSLWRGMLVMTYLQAFFVIGTIRGVFFELVDTSAFKSRVLIVGAGDEASYIDKKLRRKTDRRGFEIVGYVANSEKNIEVSENKLIELDSTLYEYVLENNIDEIVVATSNQEIKEMVDELVECKLKGVNVLDILNFFEREAGQIRIDILQPAWLVTSDGFRQSAFQNIVKRSFDIVVGTLLFVITLPIQIVVVLLIWLEDGAGAPVIYSQLRAGAYGKKFNVYKFRSMVTDAETSGNAVWASKGDSRVTRVGGFLRKYRLDEIPQAINVIKGDMSFVGPRPERPEFVEELAQKIPYYKERHVLKPGLTGWAQLNYPYGSSLEDAYQKQLYDMYYVKNHTLFLDCLILLQTVEVVIFGKGAR